MAAIAVAEIRALAGFVDELDYYQLLEIERGAAASEVKRAYYAASRRFHPDANRKLEGDDRAALDRIAKRISEAYQVLRDARRRRAYDAELASGAKRLQLVEAEQRAQKKSVEAHLGTTPNGRRFFNLARADIDRGDHDSAIRNLKMALTFEPKNAAFREKLTQVQQAARG